MPTSVPSSGPTAADFPFVIAGMLELVEDVPRMVGMNITVMMQMSRTDPIGSICIDGFPEGSYVTYLLHTGVLETFNATAVATEVCIDDGNTTQLLDSLESLEITAPMESDEEFVLDVEVTADTNKTHIIDSAMVNVTVLSVADRPSVDALMQLDVDENGFEVFFVSVNSSSDNEDSDNSECVFVRFTVLRDGTGPIGTLSQESSLLGVTFTQDATDDAVYYVNATGANPTEREALLDLFLDDPTNGVRFTPRPTGTGTGGGLDTQYEIDMTTIAVVIISDCERSS